MTSVYGAVFDDLAQRWAVIEDAHDEIHLDRNKCGGVGGCSMMATATRMEQEMVEALGRWRDTRGSQPEPAPRRLKSAHSCRLCGRWLEGEWASADAEQCIELQRQMDQGHCDVCPPRKPWGNPSPESRAEMNARVERDARPTPFEREAAAEDDARRVFEGREHDTRSDGNDRW